MPGTRWTACGRLERFCAVLILLGTVPGARAATDVPPALYQDTVIVTGTNMRSRPSGFARALLDVLVKVSGDPRLETDPKAVAISKHADALVAGFDYVDPIAHRRPHDDQGSYDRSYDLTVRFEPVGVDAVLSSLGARPWGGVRPVVVPVFVVRGSDPPWAGTYMLSADGDEGGPLRTAFANAATRYGIQVRLPTEAELAATGVTVAGNLPDRAVEDPAAMSLVGSITYRPEALGWAASWRIRFGSVDRHAAESGVSFDAAFDRMVREAVVIASRSGPLD